MPARPEQFFWLYAKQVPAELASRIELAHADFIKGWDDCPAQQHSCVSSVGVSDRLWLFRLLGPSQGVATRFSSQLKKFVEELPRIVDAPTLKAKRRSNLPTPLVADRLVAHPTTDIGLHVVNDVYNGMLVTYSYFEGAAGRHLIPHLQLKILRDFAERVASAWAAAACECHRSVTDCCGVGCYECFQLECARCAGTGWKDFCAWAQDGFRIDYSTGFPIAVIPGEA